MERWTGWEWDEMDVGWDGMGWDEVMGINDLNTHI